MNDGQYTNIRNYLEEHSSQNKQIIGLLERQNELLNDIRLAANRTDARVKDLATDDKPDAFIAAVTQSVLPKTTKKSK